MPAHVIYHSHSCELSATTGINTTRTNQRNSRSQHKVCHHAHQGPLRHHLVDVSHDGLALILGELGGNNGLLEEE